MTGLILKDICSLRKYFLRQIAYMSIIYVALAVAILHSLSFLSTMMTMSVMMMLVSSFSIDENVKWDAYALTMPLAPRTIVGAKYLLFYGMLIVTGTLTTLICGIVDAFTYQEGAVTIMASTGAIMVLYAVSAALFLPIVYKMGAEKARIALSLCFIIPFIGVFWAMNYFGQGEGGVQSAMDFLNTLSWPLIGAIAALISLLLAAVSFFLSLKFYEQKEF